MVGTPFREAGAETVRGSWRDSVADRLEAACDYVDRLKLLIEVVIDNLIERADAAMEHPVVAGKPARDAAIRAFDPRQ